MVRVHPDPPVIRVAVGPMVTRRVAAEGAVAQLGERLLCKQEVIGSIPFSSTNKERSIGMIATFAKLIGKPAAYL
jgi:hypothetical protein